MSEAAGPVLFCYDGSESSATAIAVAEHLLARRKALMCHVWVGLSQDVLFSDPELPGALREAAEELDRADEEATAERTAKGAQLALAAGFDAYGLLGLARAVLGSVSTALLHHSTRPVLVVPAAAAREGTAGPLLLCYDGSEPARRAIEAAGALCSARRALVLNFWASWVAEAPALAGASKTVRGMAAELDEIAGEQSVDRMKEGPPACAPGRLRCRRDLRARHWPAWKAALDTAADHGCAGIVVGSR